MSEESRSTVLDLTEPARSNREPAQEAFLVVMYGDDLGRRITLGDSTVTFGREATCSVQLDDERVSRHHARISWDGESFLLEDLQSTNGTFVNNMLLDRASLRDGDQVKVGRTIYKFIYGGTAEAEYHEVIYQLMTSDGLTKAHNKRFFDQTLVRELSRARRYRRPLALLLMDLDHFKQVNDQHGHMAGDEVLRQFSGIIAANIRREDLLARVGGEEFALLIPEGTVAGGQIFAERLRQTIAQSVFEFEDKRMKITCSFGLAELEEAGEGTPDDVAAALYKLADDRLYAAKHAGRNRVVSSG